jgi:hypothetical protein
MLIQKEGVRVYNGAYLAGLIGIVCASVLGVGTYAYTLTGYKWNVTPVLMYANPNTPDVAASAVETALKVGMNAWKGYTTFQFTYGGRVTDTAAVVDGRNVILFRNASNGTALATSYNWSSGGSRIDSDIIFWDKTYRFFTGTSGCASGAYIEDVATHELGHAAGLSHSSLTGATMYSKSTYCTQSLRSLSSDDISGLKALYPALNISTNTAPTLSISSPLSGTSVALGSSISFAGSASDSQDGTVTSRMVWRSNLDGQIGTGGAFSKALSVGSHTVTATVTDSGGLTASRQISVAVTSSGAVNVALTASGATATASSTLNTGYAAASAINGDRRGVNWGYGGYWQDATAGAFPDWLQVTFNGVKTIQEVDVFSVQNAFKTPSEPTSTMTFSSYGLVDFTVQYWTGTVWQAVPGGVVRGNNLVWRRVLFSPLTTSRIRVLVERAGDSATRIVEVAAY